MTRCSLSIFSLYVLQVTDGTMQLFSFRSSVLLVSVLPEYTRFRHPIAGLTRCFSSEQQG